MSPFDAFGGDVPVWELAELRGWILRMVGFVREQRIGENANRLRSRFFILSRPLSPVLRLCRLAAAKMRGNPRLGRFMFVKL